jgi:beta-lactamase regulating signal transducer with metallopeptidase domain
VNPHPALERSLDWLLNNSAQAAVLVVLVLLVQFLFKRRLTCGWRFMLWWVLLLRLALPFNPSSALSVFNMVKVAIHVEVPRDPQPAPPPSDSVLPASPRIYLFQSPTDTAENAPPPRPSSTASNPHPLAPSVPIALPVVQHPSRTPDLRAIWIPGLAAIWLAGALTLSVFVAFQTIRLRRCLSRSVAPPEPALVDLLEQCRREFGVARRVQLLETDAVASPALCGLFRPRLLLPPGLAGKFSPRELRCIFLHELAHIRRGDLWLNWLVTLLQVIHWFNPLLWLGFARLRADRELACDELALVRAGESPSTVYGETIIRLLEGLGRPRSIPGLIGILEDKKQMRRRISMIANFRKPGRWSALAAILIAAVAAAALTNAQSSLPAAKPAAPPGSHAASRPSTPSAPRPVMLAALAPATAESDSAPDASRPDLSGAVTAKDGSPLSATVFIATAAPKTGTSTFCPSCYADCRKSTTTDAAGNFKIDSLDPQLTFRILAVAPGYKPKYVSKVDPAKGPQKIELDPIESADATPDRSLRGRVVDPNGQPVPGAVVEVNGIQRQDEGGEFGQIDGVDPLAVTDAKGEFLVTAKDPFKTLDVKVSARAFADKNFSELPNGSQMNVLAIAEGATITGRVLADGKPVPGVSVGISGADRVGNHFLGHFEVGTGPDGAFALVNIPPDADFHLYGIMSTMRKLGTIPIQTIHTGKDGESTDVGALAIGPAYRLAGRVVLADGKPVPPKTRLLISREDAWDSFQITLNKDGAFDTQGIPPGALSLSVRIPAYHLSGQNKSLDPLNPFRLDGRVEHDITGLVVLLEKGPELKPDYNANTPASEWPQKLPLRGAEGAADHSHDWKISGHVIDADSRQPIASFRVTPGSANNFDGTAWDDAHGADGANGEYVIYISQRETMLSLKIEADGYLPVSAPLPSSDAPNPDFALTKGTGPAGTVHLPDGSPAASATVAMVPGNNMIGGNNMPALKANGELTAYWDESRMHRTGADGQFAFKPELDIKSIAAASSNGFALVSVDALATNPVITLQPYGRITGTLKRTSGPGTNEDLDVTFAGSPLGRGPVNMDNHTTTDAHGAFEFDNVPPGHLEISYREYSTQPGTKFKSWNSQPLKDVDLQPGQYLQVNIDTGDRTPPQQQFQGWRPPEPKRIAGEQITGTVLTSDGAPAAGVDVALDVDGTFISLGIGTLTTGGRNEDLLVHSGADGSFTLPMCENARSLIAAGDDGYAQIPLDQFKKSSRITLQKWGRIEGTLRISHHLGTNETVLLTEPPGSMRARTLRSMSRKSGSLTNNWMMTNVSSTNPMPPMYMSRDFQSRTDDQGRFVIAFVPPGYQTVARQVQLTDNSWSQQPLGTVDVKAGGTNVVTLGGNGRTVTGTIKFADAQAPDFNNGWAVISTANNLEEKFRSMKTAEERDAFYQSPEYESLVKSNHNYSVAVQPDGSFRADDIVPGTYEFGYQLHWYSSGFNATTNHSLEAYAPIPGLVVPAPKNQDDDSAVDWGALELHKRAISVTGQGVISVTK